MLLKEVNGGLHWSNLIKSSILDHLDVSQVTHNFHKEILILLGLGLLWKRGDTAGDFVDEVFNVLDLLDGVVKEEIDIGINPKDDGVLELLDQRSRVDSQPSDINRRFHFIDFVLDSGQHGDLLMEAVKRWLLGLNSV